MKRYTIYCTEEQTKKAFELGAPLNTWGFARELVIPTAEQMIGWLEEQDILMDISPINGLHFYWMLRIKKLDEGSGEYMWECQYRCHVRDSEYNSKKEATLAAIDVALDYLIKNKK